jgi:hypothetical protein
MYLQAKYEKRYEQVELNSLAEEEITGNCDAFRTIFSQRISLSVVTPHEQLFQIGFLLVAYFYVRVCIVMNNELFFVCINGVHSSFHYC